MSSGPLSQRKALGVAARFATRSSRFADGLIGIDGAGRDTREGFSGELVGDVEDLDWSSFPRLVEDVVQCPDLIRVRRDHRSWDPGCFLLAAAPHRHVQAFVTPQTLHPFAIARPALPCEQDVDAPIPVAGVAPGQRV
jgi:hypothetical protein